MYFILQQDQPQSAVYWSALNGKMSAYTHVSDCVRAPVVGEMMLQQAAVERH